MNRLLPFVLLFLCSATLAESGAYRTEVIVFRNLNVEIEPTTVQELRSFSQFPDIDEPEKTEASTATMPAELADDITADLRDDLPDDLQILPKRSDYMNDIWRRLRSSQNYRPLVYAAWEQNRTDYYPPMRVHDENIIDTRLRPPTNIMVADLTAEDPLAAYRSNFYQIDGSVQLRRSRFLHLYLDLEYRPRELPTDPVLPIGDQFQLKPDAGTNLDNTMSHKVFALRQNRQIRTGEVQYFDTPYFGALVFVSAITAE